MKTDRNKLKRIAGRGYHDKETIYKILDEYFVCHVGFIHKNYPVVIPTIYGRYGDFIYFHGSTASRMLKSFENSGDICINISLLDGIVLARSGFHSSLNYRSVVIFEKPERVAGNNEKIKALKYIMDHMIVGRWEGVREITNEELKVTHIYKLSLEEASAKIREGDPIDDLKDCDLDIWAGVLPVKHVYGKPLPAKNGKKVEVSRSLKELVEEYNTRHKT